MKQTIYICTAIISLSILIAGLSNRFQVDSLSMPGIGKYGGNEVIVKIDGLTGRTCIEIGDDGYNYFDATWTIKINEVNEKDKFFVNALPVQCE